MSDPGLAVETVDQPADEAPPHAYRVTVKGELDLDNAAVLAAHLDAIISNGATLVTLDAADVSFMDSTGLRTIVVAGNKLSARGGQLLIQGVSGAAQRVLEITGLLQRYQAS